LAGTFQQNENGAFTVWFTGLSGAGKSTLARALAAYLADIGLPYELLDGDEIRNELCRDLGFSKEDRDENVRRLAFVAKLLNRHGVISIVAAISPYCDARRKARDVCGSFIEVFVDCPLNTLIQRDTKGLYHRALAGELEHFTGVSDPYEAPQAPDIHIPSGSQTQEESVTFLIAKLSEMKGCQRREALQSKPGYRPETNRRKLSGC
jgi:adenylyl-sulfate kinase